MHVKKLSFKIVLKGLVCLIFDSIFLTALNFDFIFEDFLKKKVLGVVNLVELVPIIKFLLIVEMVLVAEITLVVDTE